MTPDLPYTATICYNVCFKMGNGYISGKAISSKFILAPSGKGSILKGKNLLPLEKTPFQNCLNVKESKPYTGVAAGLGGSVGCASNW